MNEFVVVSGREEFAGQIKFPFKRPFGNRTNIETIYYCQLSLLAPTQ